MVHGPIHGMRSRTFGRHARTIGSSEALQPRRFDRPGRPFRADPLKRSALQEPYDHSGLDPTELIPFNCAEDRAVPDAADPLGAAASAGEPVDQLGCGRRYELVGGRGEQFFCLFFKRFYV